MTHYKIEPERKLPPAHTWFAWICFMFLLVGFLAQSVKLQDARTEIECQKIAQVTASLAPEPERQYDNRLEMYRWDDKRKIYVKK